MSVEVASKINEEFFVLGKESSDPREHISLSDSPKLKLHTPLKSHAISLDHNITIISKTTLNHLTHCMHHFSISEFRKSFSDCWIKISTRFFWEIKHHTKHRLSIIIKCASSWDIEIRKPIPFYKAWELLFKIWKTRFYMRKILTDGWGCIYKYS